MKKVTNKVLTSVMYLTVCFLCAAGMIFSASSSLVGLYKQTAAVEVAGEVGGELSSAANAPASFDATNGGIAKHEAGYYRAAPEDSTAVVSTNGVGALSAIRTDGTASNFVLNSNVYIDVALLGGGAITIKDLFDKTEVGNGNDGAAEGATGMGFRGNLYGQGYTIYFYSSTGAIPGGTSNYDDPLTPNMEPTGYPSKWNQSAGLLFDILKGGVYDLNIVVDVQILAYHDDYISNPTHSDTFGVISGTAGPGAYLDNVHVTINEMFGAVLGWDGTGYTASGIIAGGMIGSIRNGGGAGIDGAFARNSSVTIGENGSIVGGASNGSSVGNDIIGTYRTHVGGFFGEMSDSGSGRLNLVNCKLAGSGKIAAWAQARRGAMYAGGVIGSAYHGITATGFISDFSGIVTTPESTSGGYGRGLLVGRTNSGDNDQIVFSNTYKTYSSTPKTGKLDNDSWLFKNYINNTWDGHDAQQHRLPEAFFPNRLNSDIVGITSAGDAGQFFTDSDYVLAAGHHNNTVNGMVSGDNGGYSSRSSQTQWLIEDRLVAGSTADGVNGSFELWPTYAANGSAVKAFAVAAGGEAYYNSLIEYPGSATVAHAAYAEGAVPQGGGIALALTTKKQEYTFGVDTSVYKLSLAKGYVMKKYYVSISETGAYGSDGIIYNEAGKAYNFALSFVEAGGAGATIAGDDYYKLAYAAEGSFDVYLTRWFLGATDVYPNTAYTSAV
ncbi:MAG: hypothetical protein LBQ40_07035, partial [Clostridiales bacterium]|nr:hypothetical protein [Clostridiales bacterium]